jgi:hypothetical protein
MSKIIVDQVATNGGDTFTLPAADGTTSKQPLVTDGSGTLSFNTTSPLLPAADGTVGQSVTTDGSGQLGFAPIKLPSSDGTTGQYVITNGSGQLSFDTLPTGSNLPNDSDNMIGMIRSSTARDNIYSTGQWSTSGPGTTFYSQLTSSTDILQAFNMALGDGYPNGTSQGMYAGDYGGESQREMIFANGHRVGQNKKGYYYDQNATNYPGVTFSILPIRNNGSVSKTVNLDTYVSSTSYTYSGAGMAVYIPSGLTPDYNAVTAGTWTTEWSYNSDAHTYRQQNTVITIPAGTTVLVMLSSSHYYQTTYQFKGTNSYLNLQTTFTDPDIVCDIRMLHALWMVRRPNATYSQNTDMTHEMYTGCGELFGNR